MATLRRRGDV